MPARDHLNPQGRHKPTLDRAVPETRPDGTVQARCVDGCLTAKRVRGRVAEIAIEQDGERTWITADDTELRTCIAALLSVLGQLDPDHPTNERKAA